MPGKGSSSLGCLIYVPMLLYPRNLVQGFIDIRGLDLKLVVTSLGHANQSLDRSEVIDIQGITSYSFYSLLWNKLFKVTVTKVA